MSVAAIGSIGAVGVGSLGGMDFAAHAGALAQGRMPSMLDPANAMTNSVAMGQTPGITASASVEISSGARSSLASDGLQSGPGMSDLAQALIAAMLLQLLQG